MRNVFSFAACLPALCAVIAPFVLAPLPAQAQDSTAQEPPLDWAQPLAGPWILSGTSEGDAYCSLTLGDTGVIGGAAITFSPTCLQNFPLSEVAGWTLQGNALTFIDPQRQTVFSFDPFAEGAYSSALPDGRSLALDRGGMEPEEVTSLLFDGSYTLSGPNRAEPCGFMVTPEGADHGLIEQSGLCPEEWKGKAWAKWRGTAEQGLELLAADDSVVLALAPGDGMTFVATPEGGTPLYFGPGVIEGE